MVANDDLIIFIFEKITPRLYFSQKILQFCFICFTLLSNEKDLVENYLVLDYLKKEKR